MDEKRSFLGEFLRIVAPLLILAAGGGGLAALVIYGNRDEEPDHRPPASKIPLVKTVSVGAHDGNLDIRVDGLVVPYREIRLAAEINGRVKEKSPICDSGNFVTRGTPLIEIDSRDYDLEVQRLQADLAQAENSMEELEVQIEDTGALVKLASDSLDLQKKDFERIKELFDREEHFITDADLDLSRGTTLEAQRAMLTLRSQLHLSETSRNRLEWAKKRVSVLLEKATLDQGRTKIVSPIDGVIIQEAVEPGSYVRIGEPLVVIEDTSRVEVKCSLKMDELYWIWQTDERSGDVGAGYQIPQTPVTVVYEMAGYDFTWQGVLSRYDGIGLDEATRTAPCRVVVENPRDVSVERPDNGDPSDRPPLGPPALVRGMFVTVRVHSRPDVPLVRIPELAIQPGGKVWSVRDSKLEICGVEVVEVSAGEAIVRVNGGRLEVGDRIIVSPLTSVEHGMAVEEQSGS